MSVETLPPHVWQTIIAIEDNDFFAHGAVDYRGMTRAMITNLRAGGIAAGGSSLTQQAAKISFFPPANYKAQGPGIVTVILAGKQVFQATDFGFVYEQSVIGSRNARH